MNKIWKQILTLVLAVLMMLPLSGCSLEKTVTETAQQITVDASSTTYSKKKNRKKSGTVSNNSSKNNKKNKNNDQKSDSTSSKDEITVEKDGEYSSKEEVALYIHTYGKLPKNYITKRDAEELGWDSSRGNLWDVAPGMSIGGSRFGNYEGQLPDKKGRRYYECDIDYEGKYRNAKRIIYSDDGLVFYTEDHYKTFEQLY